MSPTDGGLGACEKLFPALHKVSSHMFRAGVLDSSWDSSILGDPPRPARTLDRAPGIIVRGHIVLF